MTESTDRWRKVANAAAKDARKLAEKHLPALRASTRHVIDTELPKVRKQLPKVVKAVQEELPRVADAVRKEIKNRRGR